MPFKIDCPFCGQRIEVPDELNNTTANCPACGQEVYLTSEDAVEELDPVVEQMRRDHEVRQKEHAAELRQFAMLQQQKSDSEARTKRIINLLLWLFVYWPLIALAFFLFIYMMLHLIR